MSQRHNGRQKRSGLGLTEAAKIIQDGVVAGKAPHAQQSLQSTVGSELIGMGETLGSGNDTQHEPNQDLARIVVIGTFGSIEASLLELLD